MSIGYDGEASGGVDSTTASDFLGWGERSLGKLVRIQERQVHCGLSFVEPIYVFSLIEHKTLNYDCFIVTL